MTVNGSPERIARLTSRCAGYDVRPGTGANGTVHAIRVTIAGITSLATYPVNAIIVVGWHV